MSTFKGFTTVQLRKPPRSKFDLSHEKRLSTRMGKLVPVFVSEAMPNDTFRVNTEVMLRLAPLLAPIMHRVNVFVHFFFVPNRILWKDWETFITGGRLGTETPPVPPNVAITDLVGGGTGILDTGSLADYMGVGTIPDPATGYNARTIDMMPFAAYYKIWHDYYRDRNYVPDAAAADFPLSSGTVPTANARAFASMKTRDYQKDYFTSALPWTQRGNEVLMPLSGTGTVTYLSTSLVKKSSDGSNMDNDRLLGGSATTGGGTAGQLNAGHTTNSIVSPSVPARIENIQSVNITTSDVSINDLRRALALQQWAERNALAGSRYNESIWAHFNRKTSDGRLQRAEYLGGGKVLVKISEVVTTAFSEDGAANNIPAGNMAGHGLAFGNTNRFSYNCEEHGFIFGIMSVMPTTAYMQGSSRMFFGRNTFLDYPWPTFAHLGEQEVFKYEVYQDSSTTTADRTLQPVFGYQSRYADWKYIPSSSHGDFKSNLDFWHLTRKFSSVPSLGATFCTFEDELQDRIFAVSDVDTLWCYIYNNASVVRSLPYYGTPLLA